MAELIALGKDNRQRWSQSLPEGETLLLGRAPRNGISVPWDRQISREHAKVCFADGRLTVRELETARNPIVFAGRATKRFFVEPEGEFVIGETTFRLEVRAPAALEHATVAEYTLGDMKSPAAQFENASACLEVLCELPGLISETASDAEFASQVVDLLLKSLRGSLAAAVMQFDAASDGHDVADPKLIRWNTRGDAVRRFRPSRRLIGRALAEQQSVVHLWSHEPQQDREYTMTGDLDWAICTPIPTAGNKKWCLYVSGRRQECGLRNVLTPQDLLGELRLAELMARFIGAVRKVRVLEQHQTEMRQFFSPAVVETLTSDDAASALEPRQGPVSVLFCDVRGFSRKVEECSDDLHALLARVREALSVMTRSILKYEGVIADFQGDAALGFWGWPNASDEAPALACRAALAIQSTFAEAQRDPFHPLHGFHVGIGVCHGEAIAGRIGSDEQIKVGVFGPVVNLASRLQDLTKQMGVPILVDGATADAVAEYLPADEATCRRITRLRPAGIATPVDVFALTPHDGGRLTVVQDQAYELAAEAVAAGEWSKARQLLEKLPAKHGPARFLRQAIRDCGARPPANWDGALTMAGKDRAAVLAG